MVVASIDGDPVEPGGERRPWPESPDRKIGFEKNFLGQVLHVLPSPKKAPDDGEDPTVMQLEQGLEGSMVALLRPLDEPGLLLRTLLPIAHTHAEGFRLRTRIVEGQKD